MPQIPDSRVLIVATDGFEEWELFGPRQILQQRGGEVVLASLKTDPIQATVHDDPGRTIRPDLTVDEARTFFGVRYWGAFMAAKYAAAKLAKGGSIVFTSGSVAVRDRKSVV